MISTTSQRMSKDAVQLKEIVQSSQQPARVLAVTSGKGGVGKTNISANLGVCLAAAGRRVLLLDADMSLGNLDVILNVTSRYNISHVLSGEKTIEEIVHSGPCGLEIACGASGLEELADLSEFQRQRVLTEMSRLSTDNDIIIIDTSAGISRSVVGFCLAADEVLVVTTPEATAIMDAYAMIKVLARNKYKGRINMVVNMADTIEEGRKTFKQIANVAARFLDVHVNDVGVLLKDDRVRASVKLREPVVLAYPKAPITSSLATLAGKLDNGMRAQGRREGFFRKVVDLFF